MLTISLTSFVIQSFQNFIYRGFLRCAESVTMSHAPLLSLFQSFGAVELSLVLLVLVGLSFFFLISLFSWSFDGSNILSVSI